MIAYSFEEDNAKKKCLTACFLLFRLRSHLKNSCFVFHQGFQTPLNNKSIRPVASGFHLFFVFGTPDETIALVFDILQQFASVHFIYLIAALKTRIPIKTFRKPLKIMQDHSITIFSHIKWYLCLIYCMRKKCKTLSTLQFASLRRAWENESAMSHLQSAVRDLASASKFEFFPAPFSKATSSYNLQNLEELNA